jgi:hypothetical protein
MPPGRGKKLLRRNLPETLVDQLVLEAKRQDVEVAAVVEGHLTHSMRKRDGYLTVIDRRLDHLSRQQEQLLTLLETLVSTLDQAQLALPQYSPEEAVPVATYEQLYGKPQAPAEPPTEQTAPPMLRCFASTSSRCSAPRCARGMS